MLLWLFHSRLFVAGHSFGHRFAADVSFLFPAKAPRLLPLSRLIRSFSFPPPMHRRSLFVSRPLFRSPPHSFFHPFVGARSPAMFHFLMIGKAPRLRLIFRSFSRFIPRENPMYIFSAEDSPYVLRIRPSVPAFPFLI